MIVNGIPITNEEIEMRANLLSLGPQLNTRIKQTYKSIARNKATARRWQAIRDKIIQENRYTSSVDQIKAKLRSAMRRYQKQLSQRAFNSARSSYARTLRGKAREDLIDEIIKINAPKELGIKIDEQRIKTAVERIIKGRAKRTKKTPKQYAAHLRKLGTDISMMRQSVRAQFIWREVVRKKYRPFVRPNLKEVEEVITSAPQDQEGAASLQLKLHRIVMKLPANASQKQKIRTQIEAEKLTKAFSGCKSTRKLVASSPNASFENLGSKRLSEIPEPTRSLLRHAKVGEILPPQAAYEGFHIYALCSRKTSSAPSEASRKKAEAQIISQALTRRARGLLLDLRRRARIEER